MNICLGIAVTITHALMQAILMQTFFAILLYKPTVTRAISEDHVIHRRGIVKTRFNAQRLS